MSSDLSEKELLENMEAKEKQILESPENPTPVKIKMNRKERRRAGMKARMPWSLQVDSFLGLIRHTKYVKNNKEGVDK